MVVSSTTIAPGEEVYAEASFTMHEGMDGPHFFVLPLQTNDPREPNKLIKIRANFVDLKKEALKQKK
jgi:hypothetical protein